MLTPDLEEIPVLDRYSAVFSVMENGHYNTVIASKVDAMLFRDHTFHEESQLPTTRFITGNHATTSTFFYPKLSVILPSTFKIYVSKDFNAKYKIWIVSDGVVGYAKYLGFN